MNYDELRRVWKHIETHPEQHDQRVWYCTPYAYFEVTGRSSEFPYSNDRFTYELTELEWQCGTTACLAGWTAILNGWRPIGPNSGFVTDGERVEFTPHVACELLDLTSYEAQVLFDGTNSMEVMRRRVEEFLATEFA